MVTAVGPVWMLRGSHRAPQSLLTRYPATPMGRLARLAQSWLRAGQMTHRARTVCCRASARAILEPGTPGCSRTPKAAITAVATAAGTARAAPSYDQTVPAGNGPQTGAQIPRCAKPASCPILPARSPSPADARPAAPPLHASPGPRNGRATGERLMHASRQAWIRDPHTGTEPPAFGPVQPLSVPVTLLGLAHPHPAVCDRYSAGYETAFTVHSGFG